MVSLLTGYRNATIRSRSDASSPRRGAASAHAVRPARPRPRHDPSPMGDSGPPERPAGVVADRDGLASRSRADQRGPLDRQARSTRTGGAPARSFGPPGMAGGPFFLRGSRPPPGLPG